MKNKQPPQLLETPVQQNGDGLVDVLDDHGDHVDEDLLLKLDSSIGLGSGGKP